MTDHSKLLFIAYVFSFLKAHILDIFSKAYDIVKFQAPTATERRIFTYMRQNVLQWACNYGHEECSKAAVAEFHRYHQNPSVKYVYHCLYAILNETEIIFPLLQ